MKQKILYSLFSILSIFFFSISLAGDLFNHPKFQAFDSVGLPLSGGKVYTYAAGTSTPKATYSDQAATVPNTNPVILDSRGEATIYLSGSGAYKAVLKDSSDVTIWTMDDLTGLYDSGALGTASVVDTGTASGEVPLNSDLGTAAYKDTGVDIGDAVELQSVSGSAGLPTVDASNLTGIDESQISNLDTDHVSDTAYVYIPTGSVITWLTGTAPDGFLECDGSAVSRTTYADLFAVIGTQFGVGDGSTTFNLPDLRGYFLRGWDHGAGNDPDAAIRTDRGDGTTGDNVGTIQDHALEDHEHELTGSGTNNSGNYVADTDVNAPAAKTTDGVASGANSSTETRPMNINVMYCIKI